MRSPSTRIVVASVAVLALGPAAAVAATPSVSQAVLTASDLPTGYRVSLAKKTTLADATANGSAALAAHKRAHWRAGFRREFVKSEAADLSSTSTRYDTVASAKTAVTLGLAEGRAQGAKLVRRVPSLGAGGVVLRLRRTFDGVPAETVVIGWSRGPLVLSVQAIGAPGLNVSVMLALAQRQDVLAGG